MLRKVEVAKARSFLDRRSDIMEKQFASGRRRVYAPQLLSLGLTDRCSAQCAFCFAGATPDNTAKISVSVISDAVVEARRSDIPMVVLTGGEISHTQGVLRAALFIAQENMLMLSVQTNALMPTSEAEQFLQTLTSARWGTADHFLQLNVSYNLARTDQQTEQLLAFVRMFAKAKMKAVLHLEVLMDRETEAFEPLFNQRLGEPLSSLEQLFTTNNKRLEVSFHWPLFVGRAKAWRGTSVWELARAA